MEFAIIANHDGGCMIVKVCDFGAVGREGEIPAVYPNTESNTLVAAGVFGLPLRIEWKNGAGPSGLSPWGNKVALGGKHTLVDAVLGFGFSAGRGVVDELTFDAQVVLCGMTEIVDHSV